MQYINDTKNKEVNFLLHPLNYTQLHNKLKTVLDPKELQLFARPDITTDTTSWTADIKGQGKMLNFDQLPEEEMDNVADQLEQLKESVTQKLSDIKGLEQVAKHLFTVPEPKDIKAIFIDEVWAPLLTQWACSSNISTSKIDPLSTLLFRPRNNTDHVSVKVMYTNGEMAENKEFYVEYNGKESRESANAQGIYNRGRCKLNTTLSLFELINGNRTHLQQLSVKKGAAYVVYFPLLTKGIVTVLDQHEKPLAGEKIFITTDNAELEYTTDDQGNILLDYIEVGKQVQVKDTVDESNIQQYDVKKEGNDYIFHVVRTAYLPVTVTVQNSFGENQPGYQLVIERNGQTASTHTADAHGQIIFNKVPEGSQLKVSTVNQLKTEVYTVAANNNQYIFQLPAEKEVSVKFIDKKNKPVPGIKVDFKYNGITRSMTTDEKGVCILPYDSFVDREKVKVIAHWPEKKSKKRKEVADAQLK